MEKDDIKCKCGHLKSDHPKVSFGESFKKSGESILQGLHAENKCTKCEECTDFKEDKN